MFFSSLSTSINISANNNLSSFDVSPDDDFNFSIFAW